jgi:hypothetical protein
LLSLFIERIFIEKDIVEINRKITAVMKNNELQVPGRVRRQATTNPKPVYDSFVRKQRDVRQEISTLQSAIEINALSPLVTISQIAASSNGATLIEFKSDENGEITAVFASESIEELRTLKNQFEGSSLNSVQTTIDSSKIHLIVKAVGF